MLRNIKMLLVVAVMALVGVCAVPVMAKGTNTCPTNTYRGDPKNTSVTDRTYEANVAECNINDTTSNGGLMGTLQVVLNVIFGVIGFVAVVMLVYGGIQYTVSSGDAAKVKKAKDTILYGIVGLIIALLAAAIVNFVLVGVFKG